MKLIDLTHTIYPDMPVYPGTEQPKLSPASDYEKDGFKETYLQMFSHTGTHIDAPSHIFPGRTSLDQFPAEQFAGLALVVDCRDLKPGQRITMAKIQTDLAQQADFLLFDLGWDKYWGTDTYFGDYPYLDDAVMDYILSGDFKGIGFDGISLDPISDCRLTLHKRLFAEKDIINIENLKDLHLCGKDLFHFGCFPLKFRDADGAPARAVAWWD